MASPKMVMTSDFERGGSVARKRVIQSLLLSIFI
jgi:hypothetical protein